MEQPILIGEYNFMAKSSGKGKGQTAPSTTTTTTATDAASVAVNSGKQSSENAGLTSPNNPSNNDSKGENNNPSNDSPATDAAGITLGRGEYTPGATYNAQGQQISGWSSGPGMSSRNSSSPANIEAQFKEEARKKTAEDAKESRENEENGPNAIQNRLSVATTLSDTAKDSISRPSIALGPLRVGVANEDKISKEADNVRKGALQAAQNVIDNGGSLEDALNAYSNSYNTSYVHENTLLGDRQAIENAFGAGKVAPSTESVTTLSAPSDTSETISVLGHNDYIPGTPAATSANNNVNQQAQSSSGLTNRGSTVSTYGTGGSISSGLSVPERDTESIGLGVYDPDKANYDQDNWNRGMEQQSSSLVSDEQCKQFAMRAFHEDSPAFKVVKTTIIKKLD